MPAAMLNSALHTQSQLYNTLNHAAKAHAMLATGTLPQLLMLKTT
jgi:hypothetical protein